MSALGVSALLASLAVVIAVVAACDGDAPTPSVAAAAASVSVVVAHPTAVRIHSPVMLRGDVPGGDVRVGEVVAVDRRDDRDVLHLAIDTGHLSSLPANVGVIVSAAAVTMIPPTHPAPQCLRGGDVLDGQ